MAVCCCLFLFVFSSDERYSNKIQTKYNNLLVSNFLIVACTQNKFQSTEYPIFVCTLSFAFSLSLYVDSILLYIFFRFIFDSKFFLLLDKRMEGRKKKIECISPCFTRHLCSPYKHTRINRTHGRTCVSGLSKCRDFFHSSGSSLFTLSLCLCLIHFFPLLIFLYQTDET